MWATSVNFKKNFPKLPWQRGLVEYPPKETRAMGREIESLQGICKVVHM
jgi:hypothetical protein